MRLTKFSAVWKDEFEWLSKEINFICECEDKIIILKNPNFNANLTKTLTNPNPTLKLETLQTSGKKAFYFLLLLKNLNLLNFIKEVRIHIYCGSDRWSEAEIFIRKEFSDEIELKGYFKWIDVGISSSDLNFNFVRLVNLVYDPLNL
jgi:hypothetical protein